MPFVYSSVLSYAIATFEAPMKSVSASAVTGAICEPIGCSVNPKPSVSLSEVSLIGTRPAR